MSEPTPVSWFVVEQGWKVAAADGSEIGTVDEIAGDPSHDIFDGVVVRTAAGDKPRYVPAEVVDRIVEGCIHLTLSPEQAARLEPYQEPAPQTTVRPGGGSWWTRFLDSIRGPKG